MPTYEYECTKCGHTFELVQSIHDTPRRRCPECRGKVRRLIGTGVGIAFKGSGFYVTDSRRGRGDDGNGGAGKKEKTSGGED